MCNNVYNKNNYGLNILAVHYVTPLTSETAIQVNAAWG